MQIKSIYQLFLTALLILFISINESYSQTSYGDNAGKQGGDLNSFFGIWSGSNNTATHNSFFGNEAGRYNVDGNKNSFFGSTAGLENTSGNHNSYVGYAAGKLNTTGSKNSFFGAYSGYYNEDGANNSYVGYESGTNNKSGENNNFFGVFSGYSNISGSDNSFFGNNTGKFNENGIHNSFFGNYAGSFNISGNRNTYVGMESGFENEVGSNNTCIGYRSGKFAEGSDNIFIGKEAGYFEKGSHKLYIENSQSDKPLIYGDFETEYVQFNGKIGIASNTGISIIENIEHSHSGGQENFLQFNPKESTGKPIAFSENGRISIGTDDVCWRHTKANDTTNVAANDTTYLIVGGSAFKYSGSFWESVSDKRLKKNIAPLKTSLKTLLDINFYSYKYIKNNETRFGIMAQEMRKLFPHSMGKFIEGDGSEYLTFNPNNLFYTGLKATQEIGELALLQENKIEQLEQENSNLKAEIEAIKTALKYNGIDIAISNSIKDSLKEDLPNLSQNNPNPFSETTNIPYFLPNATQEAFIIIYDTNGKIMEKHKLPTTEGAGNLEIGLMKNNAANGTYTYRLMINGQLVDAKKMLFFK